MQDAALRPVRDVASAHALSACPPDADPAAAPFNHSAEAVFDDAVLADGTTLLAELTLRRPAPG